MKNLFLLFVISFSATAFSFVDDSNTYQPQWELQSISKVNGEYVATIEAPISFCADEIVKVEFDLSADQHGKTLMVRSLIKNNSHFKIFCMNAPKTIKTTIVLGKNIDTDLIELVNETYHF